MRDESVWVRACTRRMDKSDATHTHTRARKSTGTKQILEKQMPRRVYTHSVCMYTAGVVARRVWQTAMRCTWQTPREDQVPPRSHITFPRGAVTRASRRPGRSPLRLHVVHVKWPLYTNVRSNDEISRRWDRAESSESLGVVQHACGTRFGREYKIDMSRNRYSDSR